MRFISLSGMVVGLFFMVVLSGVAQDKPSKTAPLPISDDPAPVKIEKAFPNLKFDRPIFLTYPPDGTNRLAVLCEKGEIFMMPNDPSVEEPESMLDIKDKVTYKDRENEEGMLGLAFHPKFKQNKTFFVYYTLKDVPHTSVLVRYKMSADNPNRADPDSAEEIFRSPGKPNWNHNGGTIIFGPDGYLYLALGDGGAANDPYAHGQSLETVLGKVLRIDVDHKDPGKQYAAPKDNPFVDMPGAMPEIWCLGLRNVWRMAFDHVTNKLWAGDVGQDTWEEVDILQRGGNYEWNIKEGFHTFSEDPKPKHPPAGKVPDKVVGDLIDPIFEYHHDIGKCVVGGCVYRGKQVPEL
ncbi:MAG TPA: PQQ-dependent sugar dehydrogenase, partial [Pirellulales bacterium]